MIISSNLNTAIVLIIVGVAPPASKNVMMVVSTILVVIGVIDLVLSLLHI